MGIQLIRVLIGNHRTNLNGNKSTEPIIKVSNGNNQRRKIDLEAYNASGYKGERVNTVEKW